MGRHYTAEEKSRALRLVREELQEYGSVTKACSAAGSRLGSRRTRCAAGTGARRSTRVARTGSPTVEREEIRALKAEGAPARGRQRSAPAGSGFLRGGTRPPRAMIISFIDELKAEEHAVELVCRVLRGQGCQVAARTYREWKKAQPCARDLADAYLMNVIWDLFLYVRDENSGELKASPESLYGRRKVTAWLRVTASLPRTWPAARSPAA